MLDCDSVIIFTDYIHKLVMLKISLCNISIIRKMCTLIPEENINKKGF